ncbi:MAG: SRPBCC family protein [Propionibacteriales bacterium]|nr:SRPBCC family protein [Propionibacteriales bacterium]
MGQISAIREYDATQDAVWDIVSDAHSFEKWMTLHQTWKGEVPENLSQGAQLTEVISMMGMPNTITWTVDVFDAPSRLVISGTGMAGVKTEIGFTVSANGAGSTVEMSAAFEGSMIVGALGKAIEKQGAQEVEGSLNNIEGLLG